MSTDTGYTQRLATLEIGLAGCHGQYAEGNCSVSIPDARLSPYFGELVEGGYVIDNAPALENDYRLAVRAPMCRGNLPAGARDAFPGAADSIVAHALAQSGPENGYSGLAQLMLIAPKCGAFDDVSPDVFAAWWASHGARVGQRRGDTIVWADGTVEPIRPFADRWKCER